MFYLNINEEGYLLSVSSTPIGGPSVESLEGLDLLGCRINAHRWDGKKLALDEERLDALMKEQAEEEATSPIEQLRADVDFIAAMTGVSL